jgi:hypothetical protein
MSLSRLEATPPGDPVGRASVAETIVAPIRKARGVALGCRRYVTRPNGLRSMDVDALDVAADGPGGEP